MIDYSFITTPKPADMERIVELYRDAGWWEDTTDSASLVEKIVTGSHCFLTGRQNGAIIAMGRAISDKASDAYIQDVTVDKAYRGKGIGSRIVALLTQRLEVDGIGWIGLIAERNTHTFYRSLGFSPMADAMPMRKTNE
jgi:spermidine synthase